MANSNVCFVTHIVVQVRSSISQLIKWRYQWTNSCLLRCYKLAISSLHWELIYTTHLHGVSILPILLKPRSHLADLTADLSRPSWSGGVLWSRVEVGEERGWVLEGPERSVNLVEVFPTIPGCFELFKTIGSGRGLRTVVDRALGSRVRSLEGR